MLTREERNHLAEEICARFVAQYPAQVLVGGVFGSTARGTDTLWSDLDMLFVVEDGCPAESRKIIYQTIAVGYQVFQRGALETLLTTPSRKWPYYMGVLDSLSLRHGDLAHIHRWLDMGQAVPIEKFHRYLEKELPGMIVEAFGRLHSFHHRRLRNYRLPCRARRLLRSSRAARGPSTMPRLAPSTAPRRSARASGTTVENLLPGRSVQAEIFFSAG